MFPRFDVLSLKPPVSDSLALVQLVKPTNFRPRNALFKLEKSIVICCPSSPIGDFHREAKLPYKALHSKALAAIKSVERNILFQPKRGSSGTLETPMIERSAKSRTLILVNHSEQQKRQDFEEIRAKIDAIAPEIDVQIVDANQSADCMDDQIWQRPCFVVSFGLLRVFRPKRGLLYCCRPIAKFEQLNRLHCSNIPVPLSAQLVIGKHLDKRAWGPLVVLKSTTPGFMSRGAVFLMRTEKVAELAEVVFPLGHPSRRVPVLVQQFVDTGEWPSYYRVLTLFGEPLYCRKAYTPKPRPPLDAPDEILLKAQIATNAESGTRKQYHLSDDADVLDLARRAYAAMPYIPLQGVDIIRHAASGRLFVLEINAGGNTWHFSSLYMELRRKSRPREEQSPQITREERIAQFGAWDVAARVLIKKTQEQAR